MESAASLGLEVIARCNLTVLLEPTEEGVGVMDAILRSDGSGCQYLHQKAGGSMRPASERTVERKDHYVYQEGKAVFKFAVTNMADVSAEIMEKNGVKVTRPDRAAFETATAPVIKYFSTIVGADLVNDVIASQK